MMTPSARLRLLAPFIALLVVSAMPSTVTAQAPAAAAEAPRESTQPWRSACHRVKRAMLRGPTDTLWERSLGNLRQCDLTGAEILADAWRRARDSAVARDLFVATAWYRDARVLDALLSVAEDETGPAWPRVYAMHAMVRYLEPRRSFRPLSAPGTGTTSIIYASHSSMSDGPVPIADTAARTISRSLLGTAVRTRDEAVRWTARGLGGVATHDAIAGGAPDTLGKGQIAALPREFDCWSVFMGFVIARKSDRWDRAMENLDRCPDLGALSLDRAWTGVREDSVTLRDMVKMSRQLRDGRLFNKLEVTAADTSAGWWRRTSAMRVLAGYLAPSVSVSPDELRARRPAGAVAASQEPRPMDGWTPLPHDHKARTRSLIRRLAREDSSPEIRSAAQVLERRLRWH